MPLHAIHAMLASLPASHIIWKWLVLFGVVMYALLALSFLVERPPRIFRALGKAVWGLWLVVTYMVVTHDGGQRYYRLFIPLLLLLIAMDLWQWRSSRKENALRDA
jgi:hypothetical protein